MSKNLLCWQCGQALKDLPLPISRHANCQACFEVLHCCRFCLYYNPQARSSCEEDQSDSPQNKESANFCEYFIVNPDAFQGKSGSNQADSKFDALFDDGTPKEGVTPQNNSGNSLDNLFKN